MFILNKKQNGRGFILLIWSSDNLLFICHHFCHFMFSLVSIVRKLFFISSSSITWLIMVSNLTQNFEIDFRKNRLCCLQERQNSWKLSKVLTFWFEVSKCSFSVFKFFVISSKPVKIG